MSQEVGIFAIDEHSQELTLSNGVSRLLFRIVGIIDFARRSLIGWIYFFRCVRCVYFRTVKVLLRPFFLDR